MSFIADQQTLMELGISGKHRKASIFNIFNRVNTKGAEIMLEKMFANPLVNPEEINKRSSIFQFFQSRRLVFPIPEEVLAGAELYIKSSNGNNYIQSVISLTRKKILQLVTKDSDFTGVVTGIHHVTDILARSKVLLTAIGPIQPDGPAYSLLSSLIKIVNERKLAGVRRFSDDEAMSIGQVIYYDHLFRIEFGEALNKLFLTLYEVDLCIAVANVAEAKGFSYANALSDSTCLFKADAIRHPALDHGIANELHFDKWKNMIFLTGANMAGKSTFMKSIGVNLYLAHMGFPVAARGMEFTAFDGIYSSVNVADNLNRGYSHFYAEVLRVKEVAKAVASGKRLLVIFDELFKGTNVKDAFDGTLAVASAFSKYHNCFFIVSTHIIETGAELQNSHKNLQMLYLPTIMEDNVPVYTYKLEEGISTDRHGMKILENEKIFELLTPKNL